MPKGFFHASTLLASKAPQSRIPKCGACGLYKTCKSPKMEPTGKGKREILVVGEAPGVEEDEKGKQFVGKDGQTLRDKFEDVGIDLRRDCWVTNALICRPPNNVISDRRMIDYCRPNLIKTVEELKPKVIILLGGAAVHSLIGWLWKEDPGPIGSWVGWNIPNQRLNAWICPNWHPSYLNRMQDDVMELWFDRYLATAIEKTERPWVTVPDYRSQIKRVLDPEKAAKEIRTFTVSGKPVAFDYETNMKKPDSAQARIVSCSISNGSRTIAYPWLGAAIEETRILLHSKIPKIGSNIKFEDRWTRRMFGAPVKNWQWDTMNAAHVIDNRPKITGLKFQSFVLLGTDSYDDHIKPLLKTNNDKQVNQVLKEIDLNQLLTYNGLDSLLEYHVAQVQMKMIGYGGSDD